MYHLFVLSALDREDVGRRMSAVFLAKVEIKEKDEKGNNKIMEAGGDKKEPKKQVNCIMFTA